MKIKELLIVLILFPLLAVAQSGRLFSTDSELSSSLVNDVHQDSKGFIWIATEDGLNRYDGSKFTIFKQNRSDSKSLLNNYVKEIFEDSKNRLYFGFFNGLQIYDHATEDFEEIPLLLENNDPYKAHVLCILERKNGQVLVGTSGEGIFEIDSSDSAPAAHSLPNLISSPFILKLFEDNEENLWIITQDQGIFKIDSKNRVRQYLFNEKYQNNISTIIQDADQNIFIGSFNHGLLKYDNASDDFLPISSTENTSITSLHLSKENKILIGTDGEGLKTFIPSQQEVNETNINFPNYNFSKAKVHSIIEDKVGNLWLGLYHKGVMLIPARKNNFNYIGYQSFKNNIIGSSTVMSVFKDEDETLWVGTDGDGLYGISPGMKKKYHYSNNTKDSGNSSTIMCIFEDSKNNLWIGTYLNGLAKLDKEKNRFDYVEGLRDEKKYQVNRVFSLTEDNDDRLWIGTMGSGLFSLNLTSNEVKNHNVIKNGEPNNVLDNEWINCLLFSESDKLYIGTFDGLSILNLKTYSYVTEQGKNKFLRGKIVYSLFEDKEKNLWIGTSEGLFLKPEGEEIKRKYTTEDGLPSNIISSIVSDDENNLWISTSHGICKFIPAKNQFFNYFFNDGLQGNEFLKNASYASENQLFFGSTNGVTFFDPSEIIEQRIIPNVEITGFYLQDKSVKKGTKSGSYDIVDKAIIDADTFHLSHKDNDFSIEFSSLEFDNPERVKFLYKFDGGEWIKLQPGVNNVTFSDLQPDYYSFEVKADDQGYFSDIRSLEIIVHPPWYFSTWMKFLYTVLFIIFCYFILHQIRQRQETRKRLRNYKQAKVINEAKLQFLTNISHDIKTPISLITNPLKKLILTDDNEARQKSYRIMQRNSDRILQLIDQLIDARKLDKGQIELKFRQVELISFIQDIYSLFEDQVNEKNLRVKFYSEVEELQVWIDPKHFDKIIQNVLSNAVKFSPENGLIKIIITTKNLGSTAVKSGKKYFHIIIKDDGVGINKSEIEKVFDRFYQVNNNLRRSEGTGIGLHLTRSIAKLHHGTIYAKNNRNGVGCKFIVSIPLGKKHLSPEEIDHEVKHNENFKPENKRLISPILKDEGDSNTNNKNKPKILVIDDNQDVRNYICQELQLQYNIVSASNGKAALPIALKENPDLIISDIVMPQMNGIKFCRKLKNNIKLNHIPIILLTGKTDDETKVQGLDIGADAYLAKPFNIEILKKTVKSLIRNRKILKNSFGGNQTHNDKIEKVQMKSADEKLIQRFMDVVSKNLNSTDLNVEMIAQELGISRVHLYRKLKQLTNQSARELIRNVRLNQAAELLISKNISVSEVAYATGFSSVSKFSTSFKDFYGVSPSNYRKKNLTKNSIS
ncbi:two-component regulator propeller domain-containing protein [Salegentibacter sp. F188]|uniref:histidine kinase n=1 Tax=Autumnicola patrickiae TaxID=3075591 RepID=A0ABU3DYI3_9FLAO|nr:two-component regulator propeller domain-containing protein [Salegentibacter sp. F188]MDT0688779.1 two-component regulator propeller domain-containing protein [Salegentibacter sp. F188]